MPPITAGEGIITLQAIASRMATITRRNTTADFTATASILRTSAEPILGRRTTTAATTDTITRRVTTTFMVMDIRSGTITRDGTMGDTKTCTLVAINAQDRRPLHQHAVDLQKQRRSSR